MPVGLRGSRGSHGLRALIAVVGTVVPLAPGVVSGCGSSGGSTAAPASSAQIPADATIPLIMVVTGGGGAPTSSGSSSGAIVNPFGDLPDTGSSSGTSSSGSGSGGSGSVSDDGSSDSASPDGGVQGPPNTTPDCPADYVPQMCGTAPCDYRSNTCCVNVQFQARCIPGNKSKCNSDEASLHCLQACECGAGSVCCGVLNTILGEVTTECQSIPDGGLCNPHPATNTQISEQLCGTDAECTAGQGCIKQTCEYGVTTSICGLVSEAPFDCVPYGQDAAPSD